MSAFPTDLERFRDHCRRMATAGPGDRVTVSDGRGKTITLRGPMGSDEDRALWHRMADEVDTYLHDDPDPRPGARPTQTGFDFGETNDRTDA